MTPGIRFEVGGRELASAHRAAVSRMHHRIFSRPPFISTVADAEEQQAVFDDLLAADRFGICLARTGDELVGFAYGHRLPVDHRWWTRFLIPVPEEVADEWEGRTFALVDLAVDERHRGRGVGRELVAALLGSRSEERAILSTQPDAEAAHAFYRSCGWQLIGRKGPIPGVVPPFWDIYLRPVAATVKAETD